MYPQILLVSEPADDGFRSNLAALMTEEIARVAADMQLHEHDTPRVGQLAFTETPGATALAPTDLLMPVLPEPGSRFSPDVTAKLQQHLAHASAEGDRILPVCSAEGRERSPEPLDQLVAAHVHDLHDTAAVERLVRRALIMMSLRLTGGSGIFVSYRVADGLPAATALTEALSMRGYSVWRDDEPDRDHIPHIQPGTPAQRTIHDAIVKHGFVLLVDTPDAPESRWVHEEVNTAIAAMLPILPIVIAPDPLVSGSRFEAVGRLASIELGGAALSAATAAAEVGANLDTLERRLVQVVTGHARTRRRIVAGTRDAFESMGYRWTELSPARLLFIAERPLEDERTPGLMFRLLVQCCPYRRIPQPFVRGLRDQFDIQNRTTLSRFQYVILMHNAAASRPEYRSVVGTDSHLLLLDPTDLVDVFVKHGFAPLS